MAKFFSVPKEERKKDLKDEQFELGELEPFKPEEKLKEQTRISCPSQIRNLHNRMHEDDKIRSSNRAMVQAMIDMMPPYDQKKLNSLGRSNQYNVNFGEGAAIINQAVSNYVDIFTSQETLIDLPITTPEDSEEEYTPEQLKAWSAIVSEEFTREIREWDEGLFTFLELVSEFNTHGVSFGVFPQAENWQFRANGLNDIKLPRRTRACVSSIDVATSSRMMPFSELHQMIRYKEEARAAGWNVELVEKVLTGCSSVTDSYDPDNPEDWQEMDKAHDYNSSFYDDGVRIIQGLVKEFDGTISQYIVFEFPFNKRKKPKEGEEQKASEEEFVFKKEHKYKSLSEVMQVFTFYTGNNGNIHTIRGLGQQVFSQVQASNRMQCAMLDSAADAMATTYTAPSEKDIDKIPIVYAGNSKLIPDFLRIAENQHKPDLQRSAMPAMQLLKGQIDRMSHSSAMSSLFTDEKDRRSKLEVSTAVEWFSSLNASTMRLFFKPWRQLLVESAKRMFKAHVFEDTPWGRAAKEMRDRCITRGVPEEILDGGLDYTKSIVSLPLGLGNKAAQEAIYAKGTELLSWMDESGREKFNWDRAISLFGPERTYQYFGDMTQPRPIIDEKIAELENATMLMGQEVSVMANENFLVHLEKHIQKQNELIESLKNGEIDLRQFVQMVSILYEHSVRTYEVAVVPNQDDARLNLAKQALQQIGEIVENGRRMIQREQAKARQEAIQAQQQPQEGQQGGEDVDGIIKLRNAELDMQIKSDKANLDNSIKQQKAQQEAIIRQQEAAQKRALMEAEKLISVRPSAHL